MGREWAMRWSAAVGLALALSSLGIMYAADVGRRGGGRTLEGSLVLAGGSNTAGNDEEDEALTLGESMIDGKLIAKNAKLKFKNSELKHENSELKHKCGHKCKSKRDQ